jgi:uncharacterized damage-inducible protein DinB
MKAADRIPGFRGEFLWELDIATRQHLALAEAFPPEKYSWRPDVKARAVSEVFVHVAAGILMLLEVVGATAGEESYKDLSTNGPERFLGMIRKNDELEASHRKKNDVLNLLKLAFRAAEQTVAQTSDAELDRPMPFFYEQTTVRRLYLRLLVHTHEHMGQVIAYLRSNGIAPHGKTGGQIAAAAGKT